MKKPNKKTIIKRKQTLYINKLISQFNQETNEIRRERLMEKIGEYG